MGIKIIEDTRQRIVFDKRCGDLVVNASQTTTQSAVFNETIPVIGNWTDYTGSDNQINSQAMQQYGGITNRFQGQVANIEGKAKLGNLGEVGENTDITRRRLRKIYLDISKDK